MTSFANIRDPRSDHLLTPQNAALLIVDYQPTQVSSVASRSKRELVANVTAVTRIGKLFGLPINVKTGVKGPAIHQITDVLTGAEAIDRTSINAWEDENFVKAIKAAGRKEPILVALWTEVCMAFPALDALKEGSRLGNRGGHNCPLQC